MSDAPPGKSHVTTWTLLALAVPLLYLLSVPSVKVAVVRPRWTEVSGRGSKTTHIWTTIGTWPDWLRNYCAPYHWLKRETPLKTVLHRYDEWWYKLGDK